MRTFNHYHMGRLCPIIVTILATMLWGSLTAQEEPDTLLYVRVVEIHAGKTGEFVDLMQEMTAAREEAGMPGRWVWQEAVGNTSTYHIVTVGKNFAEFGESSDPVLGEAGSARWISRIRQTVKSRDTYVLRMYPELEIEPGEGQEPNLLVLQKFSIAQGRTGDFREWLTDKVVPALRKVGASARSYARTLYGDSHNTFIAAVHHETWADLDDSNPFSELTDEEREDIFSGREGMILDRKRIILRYRASMSNDGPEEE